MNSSTDLPGICLSLFLVEFLVLAVGLYGPVREEPLLQDGLEVCGERVSVSVSLHQSRRYEAVESRLDIPALATEDLCYLGPGAWARRVQCLYNKT